MKLLKYEDIIFVYKGRIQGFATIHLPTHSVFTEKLVMDALLKTLDGGVGATMTEVR